MYTHTHSHTHTHTHTLTHTHTYTHSGNRDCMVQLKLHRLCDTDEKKIPLAIYCQLCHPICSSIYLTLIRSEERTYIRMCVRVYTISGRKQRNKQLHLRPRHGTAGSSVAEVLCEFYLASKLFTYQQDVCNAITAMPSTAIYVQHRYVSVPCCFE